MRKTLPIRNWAHDDKPREKMILKGNKSLSDAELLAILIGSGNREESAVELARRILISSQNKLNQLAKFTLSDFQKFNGIGEAKEEWKTHWFILVLQGVSRCLKY